MEPLEHYRDTIFALSSGAGVAGVAVIRISGQNVRFGLETIIGQLPQPRRAELRTILGSDDQVLDRGLVLYFPAPASFTGEDCAELHVHGGRAVIESVLQRLADLENYRSAEPGEFTRRAFENGKMDLTEVEGLADLLQAQTEMQRRMAQEQSAGSLSKQYELWRKQLIRARAMIEADFDFADEEDVPGSVVDVIWSDLANLSKDIADHLEAGKAGEIIRNGFRVVLLGAPNAGKSSLLNALAQRDVAIVSEEKGTTRDMLEVQLNMDGYPVIIHDTAGIRKTESPVEAEGMKRALQAAGKADLIILLVDPGEDHVLSSDLPFGVPVLRVGSKADINTMVDASQFDCLVSVKQSNGLESLFSKLNVHLKKATYTSVDALPNRQRHREYLYSCVKHIDEAVEGDRLPLELRSESLRSASDSLGRLTGRIDVDDLLDVIFGEFCIGK